MVRLHPRERVVQSAESDLLSRVLAWSEEHDLTTLEMLSACNGALGNFAASLVRYGLREERHGNTDTPSGWAKEDEANG